MRDSFVFYKEWRDALTDMPDGIRAEVYDAIVEYGITGNQPVLKPMAEIAFRFVKTRMDKDAEKYDNIRRERSEAGRRHTGNQYSRGQVEQTEQNGTNGTNGTDMLCNDMLCYNKEKEKEKLLFFFQEKERDKNISTLYIFLQRNIPNPVAELCQFIDYNNVGNRSWDSMTLTQTRSAARLWHPRTTKGTTRFDERFLSFWTKVVDYLIKKESNDDLLMEALGSSIGATISPSDKGKGYALTLLCSKAMMDWLESQIDNFKATFSRNEIRDLYYTMI